MPLIYKQTHASESGAMSDSSKNKIGRYEIINKISKGLYGTVYLAHDPSLQRSVAIKIINRDLNGDSSTEARIVSRLKHRNIIQIYDFGYFSNAPYLVFEYVQGQTLKEVFKLNSPLEFNKVISLVGPILDAMAYAHSMGVIHLDLNLSNILIDELHQPMIMDFGLSRISNANLTIHDSQTVNGSPLYMAPEHFNGNKLDTYTDVYAIGAILYKITTGKFPSYGKSITDIAQNITNGDINYSHFNDSVEKRQFSDFLKASLEKDFTKRYRNAFQMNKAFKDYHNQVCSKKQEVQKEKDSHSTIQFLLRRMKRKKDFPSITRTLTDINRLTSSDTKTSTKKLAEIILKDYALTNKLLKYVNSAYYGNKSEKITSISRAVVILGYDQVKMIANGLTFFNQLKGDASNNYLRDSMVKSFFSGLIARHLAQKLKLFDVEEAFICGLFQNLGENLSIYYFPEEHEEIIQLVQSNNIDKYQASKEIFGVDFSELGIEVARSWQLSESILDSINGVNKANPGPERNAPLTLSMLATFANLICDV